MGLIEIIGETINPGKMGTVDIKKGKKEKKPVMLILKTILSIIIVAGLYYLIFGISFHLKESLLYIAGMAAYSFAGYFVMPEPDCSNVGWLGGLIDNPFRISDDFNRMLVFVTVLLLPGRLISTTIASWIELLKKS